MLPRCLRVLLVAACVTLACGSSLVSARRRVHHHQGESLKSPSDYLEGVDQERFRDAFATSYAKTQKSDLTPGAYSVGVGIGDVTAQIAEIGFMGYAQPTQKGGGLLQRMRSRAFIFVDDNGANQPILQGKGAPKRVVYVSIDLCMVSSNVRTDPSRDLCSLLSF